LVGLSFDPAATVTFGGIMLNLATCTDFISDQQIKVSTAASSFSLEKLRDEPMTVFLIAPDVETNATWLRLVITSAMKALKNRANVLTPPKHRCMFLIDEFGSMGQIADIPRDIAQMSGLGLDFTLIVQNLGQLKDHYGEAAKTTILGNCGYQWFCFIKELETAKYLSESLGKKTVRTTGTSTSQGTSGEHPTSGTSTTYGETGRDLLTPDEILNLGRDAAILLNPSTHPHYLRTLDYFNLPAAFQVFKNSYPQFYWQPPLTFDDNPYWHDAEKEAREKRERLAREKLERERQQKAKLERERQERERQEQAKRDQEKQERDKQKQEKPGARTEPMTEKRAREILEVPPDATKAQIKDAYNRLMKRVHPDMGGSNFFAAQLNEAKEVLLGD
jgi:type IV secretion system protein VirD4